MHKLKLKTKYIGKGIHYFDEVNSTNEKADKLAANVEEGTVIIDGIEMKRLMNYNWSIKKVKQYNENGMGRKQVIKTVNIEK